jgi:hypothetical protein
MKRMLRSIAISATLALGGLLASSRPVAAGVRFDVAVRAPHAAFTFGIGQSAFPVGRVVARPFARRVFYRPRFGYGFWAPATYSSFHRVRHALFVPVRRYRTGWIVVAPRRVPYRSR